MKGGKEVTNERRRSRGKRGVTVYLSHVDPAGDERDLFCSAHILYAFSSNLRERKEKALLQILHALLVES